VRRLLAALILVAGCGAGSEPTSSPDAGLSLDAGSAPDTGQAPDTGSMPDTGSASDTASPDGLEESTDGRPEDGIGRFTGQWQYRSGTENTQCPTVGVNNTAQLQGTKLTFARGNASGLTGSDTVRYCLFTFDVQDNTATARANQLCPTILTSDSVQIPTLLALISAVFAVSGDTAHFSYSITYSLNVQGSSIPCALTGSGDLLRISR